jgi:hypothetical protein
LFVFENLFASAKIHKKSRKPSVSPIIFLTKAPPRHEETEAALAVVSEADEVAGYLAERSRTVIR